MCVKCSEDHRTENCQKSKNQNLNVLIVVKPTPQTGRAALSTKKQKKKHTQKRFLQYNAFNKNQRKLSQWLYLTVSPNINITPQMSNVNNPSLLDILSALTNITKSLENITSRLD